MNTCTARVVWLLVIDSVSPSITKLIRLCSEVTTPVVVDVTEELALAENAADVRGACSPVGLIKLEA